MRFSRIFFIITLVSLVGTVHFSPKYNLSVLRTGIVSSAQVGEDGIYRIQSTQKIQRSQNTWYIGVDKSVAFSDSSDFCVDWKMGNTGKTTTECLDFDAVDSSDTSKGDMFTFPVMTDTPTDVIDFTIRSRVPLNNPGITLYSMNTKAQGYKVTFELPKLSAGFNIISRAEWGADETMRYADSPYWKGKYADYLSYVVRPKTQTELDTIYLDKARMDFLKKYFPDITTIMSLTRYENGHPLVWPIQKVKEVNRIVIHHTAENMNTEASDEETLRAIYVYHTLSRQWGDIGYNYIVGQRGSIYEGRAGGDYVAGAHVSYNNMGTIGVAVMGNFQKMVINRDQQAGLESVIQMVARKYGITLSDKIAGVHLCNTATCSPLEVFTGSALLGHGDIGVTSCPGENIHKLIPELITKLNIKYNPVINTVKGTIDPLPRSEEINVTPISTSVTVPSGQDIRLSVASNVKKVQYIGKKLKIKLSYPDEKYITISSIDSSTKTFSLGSRKIRMGTGDKLDVGIVGNNQLEIKIGKKKYKGTELKLSGTVVRIDSWARTPAWDTTGKYNDNLFRDTLVIRNDEGKLLVVNELPLEWYLKGMGEVSNSEMPEKVKTIVVAARSYAKHYMSPQNRKYNTKLYDGSDDPDSFQKYLGYGYESRSPSVALQVDNTRGLVITYNRKPIKPWYFSSSNGKTLSYLEYCQNTGKTGCTDIPYLHSVDDPGAYGHTQAGHGVGISGVGATYWAGQGWGYQKILAYYLPGTRVERR